MLSLVGLRVVRGPEWKWGDQDGGEGNVGTVISLSPSTESKPGTVTVVWDSGLTGQYRGGPDGHYDLRIIDNKAVGVEHPGIVCDGINCWSHGIRGIRWECVDCNINLCTSCFMEDETDEEHFLFRRYTNQRVAKSCTINRWEENGPESRIKLIGIFPEAKLKYDSDWYYDENEDDEEIGLVIEDIEEDVSDRIVVKWFRTKKTIHHERIVDGKLSYRAKELSIGGYYSRKAFPVLVIPMLRKICVQPSPFSIGDEVQIDMVIKIDELKMKQKDHGGYKRGMYAGAIGTVMGIIGSDISVKYKGFNQSWQMNPSVMKKLNKFSVNQVIRIRDDEETIQEIEEEFEEHDRHELEGAVGRVVRVDPQSPDKLYLQFDNDDIHNWLSSDIPLPSGWMEPFETDQPSLGKELIELEAKLTALFFDAIERGDLRIVKLLHNRHRVNVDASNTNSMTALHLACQLGHKELVKWLLNEAEADLEKQDDRGLRAIHYAANSSQPQILKILILRGVELDCKTRLGETALHFAVSRQFTECIRILIRHGCNVNIQDMHGDTPLHHAILFERSSKVVHILTSCDRINWKLRNKKGFNVLHLAVIKNDLTAMELVLDNEDKELSLELMRYKNDKLTTVLHYACIRRNFKMAKLLVDHQKLRNQLSPATDRMTMTTTTDVDSLAPNWFERFLESKNNAGMTSFLIASQNKDYATIELLIEAGADVQALDSNGNTALCLIASSSAEDLVPSGEQAPSFCQFYWDLKKHSTMKMMMKYPILFPILYLMDNGCCWGMANDDLKTASDILKSRRYAKDVIDLIDHFAAKKRNSIGILGCMGQQGDCEQPPVFKLSCPHRPNFTGCSKCFLGAVDKCGCADENIVPTVMDNIPSSSETDNESENSSIVTENLMEEDLSGYDFKWIKDTSEYGFVEDQFGNKYRWFEYIHRVKLGFKETVMNYRCESASDGCPAVVQVAFEKDGRTEFHLQSAHKHSGRKRKRDSTSSSETSSSS